MVGYCCFLLKLTKTQSPKNGEKIGVEMWSKALIGLDQNNHELMFAFQFLEHLFLYPFFAILVFFFINFDFFLFCFLENNLGFLNFLYSFSKFLLGEKFRPLNEMLGSQTETQLWALEMTPIGFRCDDKPIQARRNKNCT